MLHLHQSWHLNLKIAIGNNREGEKPSAPPIVLQYNIEYYGERPLIAPESATVSVNPGEASLTTSTGVE